MKDLLRLIWSAIGWHTYVGFPATSAKQLLQKVPAGAEYIKAEVATGTSKTIRITDFYMNLIW